MVPLPIDAHLTEIVALVREHRALVVTAAPGAGKTTRVPAALVDDGPVLLLQPRRVAARAIARRIAEERQWTVGREVGWHVRFDRHSSPDTRLLVVTEGILTARVQQDPLLSDIQTVVLDEFHERSVYADLGLAFARQAWLARTDLRIVVMSATLDAERASAYLDGCPVVNIPGRLFPIEIAHAPGARVETVVPELLNANAADRGGILCFLPGAPEIRRAKEALQSSAGRIGGVSVLSLHGSLSADEQDAAIRPAAIRRVILATNIAETTLTVPDIACVVDTGLQKAARFDAARAIDSLELERISQDSAEQRAGRAGRTGPGKAVRLWDSRDRLRPHREPEIARIDLAGPVLDVLACGADPSTFDWYEQPDLERLDAARALLRRIDATDDGGRLTERGRCLHRLPLHPRLGVLLLAGRGSYEAATACALLSERHFLPARTHTTSSDLLAAMDADLPRHILDAAAHVQRIARHVLGAHAAEHIGDDEFGRAVLAAFPDRVARRRSPRSDRLLLASGSGARLARESGVHEAEFLVALDIGGETGRQGPAAEPLVRLATAVDPEWLEPTSSEIVSEFDAVAGAVRATRVTRYGKLTLAEQHVVVDPHRRAEILAAEYLRRGPTQRDVQLLRRVEFAGLALTFADLVTIATGSAARLTEIDLEAHLAPDVRRALDRDAPRSLALPGGRTVPLDTRERRVRVGEAAACLRRQRHTNGRSAARSTDV